MSLLWHGCILVFVVYFFYTEDKSAVSNLCFVFCLFISRAMKNLLYDIYVNNKSADQPAHPCSLISTFVVPALDNIQ